MSKAITCIVTYSNDREKVSYLQHHFNVRIEQLENKHTIEDIVDGVYEYYVERLENMGIYDGGERDFLAFETIGEDLFIFKEDDYDSDFVIILESSKYYKWFNNMSIDRVVATYTEHVITSHVMDIILDSDRDLIVYKKGVRSK